MFLSAPHLPVKTSIIACSESNTRLPYNALNLTDRDSLRRLDGQTPPSPPIPERVVTYTWSVSKVRRLTG